MSEIIILIILMFSSLVILGFLMRKTSTDIKDNKNVNEDIIKDEGYNQKTELKDRTEIDDLGNDARSKPILVDNNDKDYKPNEVLIEKSYDKLKTEQQDDPQKIDEIKAFQNTWQRIIIDEKELEDEIHSYQSVWKRIQDNEKENDTS